MGGERASCGSLERKAKPGSHPTQDGHSSTADSELPSLSLTLPTHLTTPFSPIHSFPITLSTPDTGTMLHSKEDKGGVFSVTPWHRHWPVLVRARQGLVVVESSRREMPRSAARGI